MNAIFNPACARFSGSGWFLCLLILGSGVLTAAGEEENVRVVHPGTSRAQVQEAIDGAGAGQSIVFAAGTYSFDEALVIENKDRLTLKAQGAVTFVCDNRQSNVITVIDSPGITLEGLHLTHTNPGDGSVCVGHVLFLSGSTDTVVRNCNLDGCGAIGIYAYTQSATVTGSHIHNCSVRPIEFVGLRLRLKESLLEARDPGDVILFARSSGYVRPDLRIAVDDAETTEIEGLELSGCRFRAAAKD